jgi:hypothetical protein
VYHHDARRPASVNQAVQPAHSVKGEGEGRGKSATTLTNVLV